MEPMEMKKEKATGVRCNCLPINHLPFASLSPFTDSSRFLSSSPKIVGWESGRTRSRGRHDSKALVPAQMALELGPDVEGSGKLASKGGESI